MRRFAIACLPFVIGTLSSSSCSDDGAATGGGGSTTGPQSGSGSTGTGFSTGTGMQCVAPCYPNGLRGDPGVCLPDGTCCATTNACGTSCCPDGAVCSFLQCVVPGTVCHDDKDCAPDEYCDFSLGEPEGQGGGGGSMCPGGVPQPDGKCMPKPPVCPDGQDPGDPPTCVTSCQYVPPAGVFTPELKYAWGNPASVTDNVMMSPIVVQLDDDNCDTVIDEKDIPEIVFFTFDNADYNNTTGTSSTLHAISIVEGQVVSKLAVGTDGASADSPGRSIAGGDIDGDGTNEIVVCTKDGRLRAYEADGTIQWTSAAVACFMPSIADLDQDGAPEVIDVGHVVDGATGATEATFATDRYVVVYDVDGDGLLDIVSGSRVHAADGSIKVDTGLSATHPAVGDLDFDGVPEIVAVHFQTHTVHVWRVDSTAPGGYEILRQNLDINYGISPNPCCAINPGSSGCLYGGGTPTIAHFNDDVYPDVGLAGGIGYVVFDGQALTDTLVPDTMTRLWLTPTQDCSSAQTGSSVFDFDGDGVAEVVYADETTLHVYAGPTGAPLFETCNTNGTLWEFPLVADVDSDGHADIVVASNSYSSFNCSGLKTTGVRVFGDLEGKWVRTRRVWNQHAYHVTNVEESGAIPAVQASNHTTPGLNNFRQNVQPSGQFAAPDLVVSVSPVCDGPYGLRARVLNIGEAPVEPGVVVGFYEGVPPSGTSLGSGATQLTLYPLTYEDVILPLAVQPVGSVYAVVDDGMPPHPWHECRTDNNTSVPVSAACGVPQ
jgi:hypothetical protein